MGSFFDPLHDLTVYEAPKNGGTTLRLWIYYALTGRGVVEPSASGYYTGSAEMTAYLLSHGYRNHTYLPSSTSVRIAIKRDPAERFLSCYFDKIVREKCGDPRDVDRFLSVCEEHYRDYEGDNSDLLAYHFCSQVRQFGRDPSVYTHVYTVDDLSGPVRLQLEDIWNVSLPGLHARNSETTPATIARELGLTDLQLNRIRRLYECDYTAGWC